MNTLDLTEIVIEPATIPGYVLVVVGEYVSAHKEHARALSEALCLQKGAFAPAVIRDLVGGANADAP